MDTAIAYLKGKSFILVPFAVYMLNALLAYGDTLHVSGPYASAVLPVAIFIGHDLQKKLTKGAAS